MNIIKTIAAVGAPLLLIAACSTSMSSASSATTASVAANPDVAARLAKYTTVRLAPDLSALTDSERKMIPLLIEAAKAVDDAYWIQVYGDKESFVRSLADPEARRLGEINYGPWDRLDEFHPFVPGVGKRPAGANYYPADMSKAEFEAEIRKGGARADSLKSLYTMVRRDAAGRLTAIPFSQMFAAQHGRAARYLDEAPLSPRIRACAPISPNGPRHFAPTTINRATSRGWT